MYFSMHPRATRVPTVSTGTLQASRQARVEILWKVATILTKLNFAREAVLHAREHGSPLPNRLISGATCISYFVVPALNCRHKGTRTTTAVPRSVILCGVVPDDERAVFRCQEWSWSPGGWAVPVL
jgi:hypothetical protein